MPLSRPGLRLCFIILDYYNSLNAIYTVTTKLFFDDFSQIGPCRTQYVWFLSNTFSFSVCHPEWLRSYCKTKK